MVKPGPVVHTVGQLHKQNEVLRPQVERSVRSAKVEAFIFVEFPFGIFASVTLPVLGRLDRRDELQLPGLPAPEQSLAAFGSLPEPLWWGFANLFAEGLDRVVCLGTHCHYVVDLLHCLRCDMLGIDCNQYKRGKLARQYQRYARPSREHRCRARFMPARTWVKLRTERGRACRVSYSFTCGKHTVPV